MEVHVNFRGRKPVPQHVDIGTERENKVTVLCFEGLPKMDGSTAYLHIDLGKNSDAIEIIDGQADVTRTITQFTGSVEAFVEVLGANDRVWHSQIMELFVGRLPILGEKIEQAYPTAFEQALAQTAADKAAAAKSAADAAATAAGIVTEEAARQDAERKRVKAEAARETAEGNREKAETAREQKTDAAVKRADDLVKNVEAKLENGEFIGAQGSQGPAGATGPQGVPGTNGADGAPGKDGRDGLDAPQIDDTTVSDATPWSSQHIVDMLCPPLEASGNPVVCYPVSGSKLSVTASWEPVQEGSGDPSPDNVRPIKGRDSVTVTRCGENLFDIAQCRAAAPEAAYGLAVTVDDTGLIRVFGTPTVNKDTPNAIFRILFTNQVILTKEYKVKWFVVKGVVKTITRINNDNSIVLQSPLSPNTPVDIQFRLMYYTGTTAPTTYTPYIGQTNTLTLPETVYGGEVDAVTGEGQETWKTLTLDGTENWNKYGSVSEKAGASCFAFSIDDKDIGFGTSVCNKFVNTKNSDPFFNVNMKKFTYTDHPDLKNIYMNYGDDQTVSLDEWKSYLAAQYAAGTPVQIAYKLATPTPFTATGGGTIKALSGTNTILTDADALTVTGRADPIRIIQQLQAASVASAQALADVERAVTDI